MLASKAVIFTHMPIPVSGQPHAYTDQMAHDLIYRIKPYLKAYSLCRNIGLVYVYVDTGVRLTLQHLAERAKTLQFELGELEFEQNTRNCLKLAVDEAIYELSQKSPSFNPSLAPKIQFIGLPHLFTLLHSLYRIDPNLLQDLAGSELSFTYDSPKFVEAVIRLVRGNDPVHSQYPIFRIDEDVEVNETGIGLLLEEAREVLRGNRPYPFFSGGYGSSLLRKGDLKDPVSLAIKFRDAQDPLSDFLQSQFSSTTQKQLGRYNGANPLPESLHRAVVDELNRMLRGPNLFNEQRFTQVKPSEEVLRLLRDDPQGEGLVRLNRLLLEEAYPNEIAKSRSNEHPADPVNDYAVRLHWLVDRNTHTLSGQGVSFLRDLGEFGATQVSSELPTSDVMSNYLQKERKGRSANRDSQQVISGAGLYMSRLAIRTLPPFMNFRTPITWIDDHLKRRLHEVLGHIHPGNLEHVEDALFRQDRHPDGISDKDIKWAGDVYFGRLLSGCIMHMLITTPDGRPGELAAKIDMILQQGHQILFDEEELRDRLEKVARDTALAILNIWKHADYGSALLSQWAEDMSWRLSSWLFQSSDFKGLARMAIKLREAQDPASQYLRGRFSPDTQQQLSTYNGPGSLPESLERAIIEELNQVLKGVSLLDQGCVAHLFYAGSDPDEGVPKQIQRLAAQNPQGNDLIRLNRLLLERAYPREISSTLITNIVSDSISYVHLVSRWPQYVDAIVRLTPVHAFWLFRHVTGSENFSSTV